MSLHPSAEIADDAELHPSAEIGAFVVIGENVRIGPGVKVEPFTHLRNCSIGENTKIGSHTSIGGNPQMLPWEEVPSSVEIGRDCWIHEMVTIHRSKDENGLTKIGDSCMVMSNTHIGHDCKLANNVIVTTYAGLSGHVEVGEFAIIGGAAGIHQFVRIGAYSMLGAMCHPKQDVPPFMLAEGNPARILKTNSVGLKRKGFSASARKNLKDSFKTLFKSGLSLPSAIERLKGLSDEEGEVKKVIDFVSNTKRGLAGG